MVIAVHDAFEEVERCVAAVARCRDGEAVVLVDDGSLDPRITPLLEAFAATHEGVTLVRQANQGYVAAANAGARASDGVSDLLFLNSDTIVTRGWLAEMRRERARTGAAIACPLTSNGNALSVPRFMQANPLPPGWDAERMAGAVRASAAACALGTVALATPVGFCMLVGRRAWEQSGPFDPAYGRGYGEEDEFGQRVRVAGGLVVCVPGAYVWHRGSASFGPGADFSDELVGNLRLVLARWPGYLDQTREFTRRNPLRALHERLWDHILCADSLTRAHVLHALPRWELHGAMRERMLSLLEASAGDAVHTIVVPVPPGAGGDWIDAIDHEAAAGWRVCGVLAFEASFERFLAASPASVVHVHGEGPHARVAVAAARSLRRPAIATEEGPADAQRCARTYARYRRPRAGGGEDPITDILAGSVGA